MPLAMGAALILALAAVTAALVLLLLEARRAVRVLESFLASAQKDLSGLAEDAHAARQQLDAVADGLRPGLQALEEITRCASEAGRMFQGWMSTYRQSLERGADLLGIALGAARAFTRHAPDSRSSP